MTERNFDEALHGLETGAGAAQDPGAPQGAEADAASHPAVAGMRARFADTVLHHTIAAGDEHVVYVAAERVREVLQWLHDDDAHRYDLLLDLTAVDYGGGRPLEVFYQLWSTTGKLQLRVKVTLPLTELEVDSVTGIWHAADWLERETWDMFGIHFRGHPDLRRILMPDNYAEGHPLRKDFPLRGRFTRAEQTRRALSMAVEDFYTPDELSLGRVPAAPGVTRATAGTTAAPDRAAAAATPPEAAAYPGTGSVTEASGAPGPETI